MRTRRLPPCPFPPVLPAIVPGFHAAYLEAMVDVFGRCAERTVEKLQAQLDSPGSLGRAKVEMEAEYSSLALDIIGLSVFNYDFDSVTKESPVIQAVYGTLAEAEHRSTFYIPYWNLPLARHVFDTCSDHQSDLLLFFCSCEALRFDRYSRV